MARSIDQRLQTLRARRLGTDRLARIAADSAQQILAKAYIPESWESRTVKGSYTRYALGAMQEVDPDYTRISKETAERVANQLAKRIANIEFRLQGSVPLNVHIRGVSDVDLLTIDTTFLTYMRAGQIANRGGYVASSRSSSDVLQTLRDSYEKALEDAFPAATVDKSGGKAINLYGASLPRAVDVVPSHWNDTLAYQVSLSEDDRGIVIFDKRTRMTIDNLPFLHIRRITDRCNTTYGSLRKAIRLCKNVKDDADTDIRLPSFDIAATMYHANVQALMSGVYYELAILAETQRHLDQLATDHTYARTLLVPDGSRRIFDTEEKLVGLNALSIEMDDLLREVAKETAVFVPDTLPYARQIVSSLRV